jgi:hypothetical protein
VLSFVHEDVPVDIRFAGVRAGHPGHAALPSIQAAGR